MDRDLESRFFEAFPSLPGFPRGSLQPLLARAVRKNLVPLQILAQPGAECTSLPFALEGRLRVYKTSESGRELTLYRIERGECCILTATCIMNGDSFPAIAAAEVNSTILLVPAAVLLGLVEDHAVWRRFIFSLYSRRLEDVLRLLEEVAFRHVDVRIASYLLQHGEAPTGAVNRTHSQIASELGTSREVVTRILKDLEAEGLIVTLRGRIEIRRLGELRKKANDTPAL